MHSLKNGSWHCCDRKAQAACVQSFTLWQQATIEIMCRNHSVIACSCHTYVWCCSLHTSHSWWITHSMQRQQRGCNYIPSFSQWTTPITCSFCEGFTQNDLHILVTAPFCCDRKAQAACAQSFALWQQGTIEIMHHNHSIIACSHHIYVMLFFAHIPFVVNHTFNAMPTERLQQHPGSDDIIQICKTILPLRHHWQKVQNTNLITFFIVNYKTFSIFKGFEQLSSLIG